MANDSKYKEIEQKEIEEDIIPYLNKDYEILY